ncbi:hypothetical protein OG21DRAFT_1424729 [Imleria badia]|nr:hypothetical protein OG21DRAFT_1424729 [Imleria badia]
MVLAWVSLRIVSYRSLAAVLVVFVLVVSLRSLVHPHPFRPPSILHLDDVAEHTLTRDGRLLVNPDAPHPIFQLIHNAEAAWEGKRARASKSLEEAVAEYKRRYRRAPPLGFDKWWEYVVKHRVQLPDEYDEIFHDIEPFWGIDPHELANSLQELETRNGVITVQKTDDQPRFEIVSSNLPENKPYLPARIEKILAFVRDVEHELPPLRVAFSPHDNPELVSDWQIKSMALEAAENGTTLTRADMPSVTEPGWIQACPPDSPARLHPPTYPPSSTPPLPPSSPKTFIASHRDTMDPCIYPSLLTTHGQFLAHGKGPRPQRTLAPLFSHCATLLHHDIRPPVPYGWQFESDSDPDEDDEEEGGGFEGDLPWDRKVNDRLGWRGRTTGMFASPDMVWVHGHRARLVTLTNALEGNVSVLHVPNESWAAEQTSPVGEPESVPLARANPEWMDVSFTGAPIQCEETCEEMARLWDFREEQGRPEEGKYKFILDVDGNGWSGRFKRLITSNALIFKATVYPEWYTSRIAPWVHYVPIQVSYEDLYDAVSFFREHDALGRRIARAGRGWSRRFWRKEDMTAYLYRSTRLWIRFQRWSGSKCMYLDGIQVEPHEVYEGCEGWCLVVPGGGRMGASVCWAGHAIVKTRAVTVQRGVETSHGAKTGLQALACAEWCAGSTFTSTRNFMSIPRLTSCRTDLLANHTLTPDGRLLLNPDGPHPIFQLIRDAEAAWEAKCARASKTLDEAVAEYRRRYRRPLQQGTRRMWDYVVKHHVQLPDEYDEILHDIEPFWGIDPYELANTQQELETRERVVTVQKTDGHPRFEVIRSNLPEDKPHLLSRINNIIALVREVEQELPPMRVTFSPYDNPEMVSDWQIKSMALQAAAERTTLTRADIPPVTERGWIQACPPDSPARLHPPNYPPSTTFLPPSEWFSKTFIASHRDAMDPCMDPSLLTTHGQFLAHKRGPLPQRTLVPLFSLCSTLM